MLSASRLPNVLTLIAGLFLLTVSASLLFREVTTQIALVKAGRDISRISDLADRLDSGPVHLRGLRDAALLCVELGLDWRTPLLSETRREALIHDCERVAIASDGQAANLLEGEILMSVIGLLRGDARAVVDALGAARAAHPRDGWSALTRLRVFSELPEGFVYAGMAEDLDLLVENWRVRPELSRLYRDRPELRAPTLEAIRRADPLEAGRMLNLIRSGGA